MSNMLDWAKENMTPEDFKRELFELFAVTQMMEIGNDSSIKRELVFGNLKECVCQQLASRLLPVSEVHRK